MDDREKATRVIDALKAAENEPLAAALPILNGLAGFIQGDSEQSLEAQEARATVFMAICELGKAIHRSQSPEQLWAPAIAAAERWRGLVKDI